MTIASAPRQYMEKKFHQKPAKHDRWLRPVTVAELLNVSVKSIYRMACDGCFVAAKVRGSLRVRESSVDAYLQRQIALYALEHGTDGTDED